MIADRNQLRLSASVKETARSKSFQSPRDIAIIWCHDLYETNSNLDSQEINPQNPSHSPERKDDASMQRMIDFVEKFTQLTDVEREQLSRLTQSTWQVSDLKKGQVIKPAQSPSTEALFVFDGIVCASFLHHDELVISEFFFSGEPVVLPHPDTHLEVWCVQDSQVGHAPLRNLAEHVETLPVFQRVCRLFAESQLNQRSQFNDLLKSSSPMEKYRHIFTHRRELIEQVPQRLLARYLGMTPETLSRVRRQFATTEIDLNQ
ncbi:MAG TPA: hypothetical protein PLZ57_02440 [Pseudobdellovibrionaceae bacterium]|nr:hypothetical protein [Pseudobdellovibrionaceae bacterium]